ncbi:MAG: ATP-binding protein [Planctomycetes bacterium]|nr:ATP-binding protein [Planctomycetota bacterium]
MSDASDGGPPPDAPLAQEPGLLEIFRQEAEGIADRLEVLLAAGTGEAGAEALRLAHTLKGLAVAMAAHPLRDLARSVEGALATFAPQDLARRAQLLSAVDAARGLIGGTSGASSAARQATAALERPAPAATTRPPAVAWARRALLRRLRRLKEPALVTVEEQVLAVLRGRDRWRARAGQARELEALAAASGLLGHGAVCSLGLALASFLAERTPTEAAAMAARAAVELLQRAVRDERVDAPLSPEVLGAVEALWSSLGPRPEEERAAQTIELPWPDVDRPADLLQALERIATGGAILDARPHEPDGRVLRGVLGVVPARGGRREDEGFVRVPRRRLDRLLGLSEELVATKSRARSLAKLAQQLSADAPVEARLGLRRLTRHAAELEREVDHLARSTQEAVLRARLVSVRGLFALARVTVREFLSRHPEVAIDLEVEGSATEIDKGVADRLVDPVLHLVRNALVHGVEPRDARRAAGKAERARVRLAARATPAGVVIEVEDDGRGLDEPLLGRRAEERGLVLLRDDQERGLALALAAGASTSPTVTDDAGRGVGLTSVVERVRALRGRLVYRSTPGRGTLARLILPSAVATARVLLVRCGVERYALPLASVVGVEEADVALRRGLPWVRLSDLVDASAARLERRRQPGQGPTGEAERPGLERERRMRDRFAVVLEPPVAADPEGPPSPVVCLVDDVLRRDLLVVRPLGRRFAQPGIDGVALFGDGRLLLVLDVWRLYLSRQRQEEPPG